VAKLGVLTWSSYFSRAVVTGQEILEDLEATLQQYFAGIANDLKN